MKALSFFILLAGCAGAQEAPPPQDTHDRYTVNLPVEEVILDNGMKVLLVERRHVPRVYCALYWKVGSVNERPGTTGFSHFFEHMMFKGTQKLGTTDWKKDAEYNAAIEQVMAEIRALKLKGLDALRRGEAMSELATKGATNIALVDEARWKELMEKFEALKTEQQGITVGEHISKLFDSNGGTNSNASTFYDWTRYFVELPANKVELFCWLESETFLNPVWREFYTEREAVKEERRMRTEATPTGLINEQFGALFWKAHSYSWPVIGWMSDIDQYTVAEAQRYYDTHYQPANCTAVFIGDIDKTALKDMVRRYFGRLQNREPKPEPIVTREPAQQAPQRMEAAADAQPQLWIRWHAPAFVHADAAPLDLLAMILDGRSGRLWRRLIDEKQIALGSSASYWALRYGGMFNVAVQARDASQFAAIESDIMNVIQEVQEKGVTDRELQKVKNQMLANLVRELDTHQGIGDQLGWYDVLGSWRDVTGYLKRVEKVSSDDVKRVATTYCTLQGRNTLTIQRKK